MPHPFADDSLPATLAFKALLILFVFLPAVSLLAMFSIWAERKVAARIQSRRGPLYVGGWHGWAQSLADGLKLLLKEDLVPTGADGFLFRLAPYLAFVPVFAAFLALPFAPQFVFETGLHVGVLYLLAVLGVEVVGVILAGWGSNSKWAIYGAMREACQMVSYEVPLGISILCGVTAAGTLDVMELSYLQGGGIGGWFAFHNPFLFLASFIYFVASLAANKRAPFDLPESESELVAGFHTEYSGLRFSYFFFAEYAGMFVVGGIQAVLFLGGWNSPLGPWDPIYALLGYDPLHAGARQFAGALAAARGWSGTAETLGVSPVALAALNLYGLAWFLLKAMGVVFVQMWLRWTLPRVRIDQVLYACVKVLLPMSLVALAGTAAWVALVPQPAPAVAAAGAAPLARLGHLLSPTPRLQTLTQAILAAVGLAMSGYFFLAVPAWAWVNRAESPPRSMFPEAMPVGREAAFRRGAPPPSPSRGWERAPKGVSGRRD